MVVVYGHIDVGRGEECLWFDGIQGSSHAGSSGALIAQEWERACGCLIVR